MNVKGKIKFVLNTGCDAVMPFTGEIIKYSKYDFNNLSKDSGQ